MNKIERVKITVEALKQMYQNDPYWVEYRNMSKEEVRAKIETLNNVVRSHEYNQKWLAKNGVTVEVLERLHVVDELKKLSAAKKEAKA